MAICLERAVPLAFHLCCFYFSAVLIVDVKGRIWNLIVSVPDHCLFIFFTRFCCICIAQFLYQILQMPLRLHCIVIVKLKVECY